MTPTLTPLIAGTLGLAAAAQPTQGINVLSSPTYGRAYSFGNVPSSFTFSGTGSPADIFAPVVFYEKFGTNDGNNTPIAKTTQAWFSAASYYGPTSDDSMECGSTFVAAKNTGTGYTQSKAVTGFESHAQVEGSNHATGNVIGVAGRISAVDTATIDNAFSFYSGQIDKASGATMSNFYAFYQAVAGPGTNNWAFYGIDPIQSEKKLSVAKSGNGMDFSVNIAGSGGGVPAFVHVKNPDSTDFASLRIDAISGQTQPALVVFDSSGNQGGTITRLGSFISTAGFFAQNSGGTTFAGMNTDGLFTQKNAAPVDGNVSAGQCFLWFDKTNGSAKLMIKGKTTDGTVVTGSVTLA